MKAAYVELAIQAMQIRKSKTPSDPIPRVAEAATLGFETQPLRGRAVQIRRLNRHFKQLATPQT
jgi:hypothetical protein